MEITFAGSNSEGSPGKIEGFHYDKIEEALLKLLNSDIVFSDILLQQDFPIVIRQAKRMAIAGLKVDRIQMEELFSLLAANLEEGWELAIKDRAVDIAIDLQDCRLRANLFTSQARKRLGAVIRKFPKEPLNLNTLGLRESTQAFAKLTSGLVLVVGDTAQGKSTTIASLLNEINKTRSGHILTIEDPVETIIPNINCMVTQREVGPNGDVKSFYFGAQDALRERPDVVMIGEIRDSATAQEALHLAEAGPLVIASMHARTVEYGITKFLRLLGEEKHHSMSLSRALRGVVCQSLIPDKQGEGFVLATESLTVDGEASNKIASIQESSSSNVISSHISANNGKNPVSHSLNSDLLRLLKENSILIHEAFKATTSQRDLFKLITESGITVPEELRPQMR